MKHTNPLKGNQMSYITRTSREDFIREMFTAPAPADLFSDSDESIDDNWPPLPPFYFNSSWSLNVATQIDYDGGYNL
jgi:hypothetical protein